MIYEPPKKIRKKQTIYQEDSHSFLIIKHHKYIFDTEDAEVIRSFYWNVRNGGNCPYLYTANKYDTSIALHRLLMNLPKGDKRIIDHINQNVFDNRKSNLRITDRAGNMMNITKPQGKNVYRGVHWNKNRNKWYVSVSFRKNETRNTIYGGCYYDIEDAFKKRKELEIKYFKEFAPQANQT